MPQTREKERNVAMVVVLFPVSDTEPSIQPAALEELLSERRGARVEVRPAFRGDKRRLTELATKNAELSLSDKTVKTNDLGFYTVTIDPGSYVLKIKLPDGAILIPGCLRTRRMWSSTRSSWPGESRTLPVWSAKRT